MPDHRRVVKENEENRIGIRETEATVLELAAAVAITLFGTDSNALAPSQQFGQMVCRL